MNKKVVWLIVCCLMIVALVLPSCKAPTEEKLTGGILNITTNFDIYQWDLVDGQWTANVGRSYTNEPLVNGDWYNREFTNYTSTNDCREPAAWKGNLAESWDMPAPDTLVYKLRKGIHWQDKEPVNGREFVAEDVKWHFERILAAPKFATHTLQGIEKITCPDKYTVVFKWKEPTAPAVDYTNFELWIRITAHEVVDTYGDAKDWRNIVGTGPFIVTDHVPDSSYSYKKNPNYWQKDPDGVQLPYVDGVKVLIIEDITTKLAAIRTGKVDLQSPHRPITWEEKPTLEASNPELQWGTTLPGLITQLTLDNSKPPFSDIKVRKAVTLAINKDEMVDTLFGGNAISFNWPARPGWACFTPLEELPAATRELYTWTPQNVDKAKALLAEAGYPDGFKTQIAFTNEGPFGEEVGDEMTMVQKYWKAIGVDAELKPTEYTTLMSLIMKPFPYEGTVVQTGGYDMPLQKIEAQWRTDSYWCSTKHSDPYIDEMLDKAKAEFDVTKRNLILKDIYQHIAGQVRNIAMPLPYGYSVWQPWVKNYMGEQWLDIHGYGSMCTYIQLDVAMREERLGK